MGERFDPDEPSTFGIDTRMCKVNEIDGSWRERRTESVSEYDQIMSWVLADRLHKWRKLARASTTSVKTWLSQNLVYAIGTVALHLLIAGIVLLSVVLSPIFTASTFCYGLVIISSVSVLITQTSDVYRVGVAMALVIPLTDFLFGCLFAQTTDGLKTEFRIVTMIFTWSLSGLLYGFLCGFGFRTGAAAAALLLNHPTSVAGSNHWQEQVSTMQVTEILIGMVIGMAVGLSTHSLRDLPVLKNNIRANMYSWKINLVIQHALISIWGTIVFNYVTTVSTYIYGGLLGVGIISGLLHGRTLAAWLACKYGKHILISENVMDLHGLVMGIILGCMCGYRVPIIHEEGHTMFGVIARISPLVIVEIYRRRIVKQANPAPVRMVSSRLSKGDNTVPIKLSLWDFAGQEFYYNTHHTFLATDAVYLIVFNLVKLKQEKLRYSELERIKYWMKSIHQHADSPIILVGTHLDCVDQVDVIAAGKYIDTELFSHHYPFVRRLVFNGTFPFFAIDNSGTISESSAGRNS